MPTQPPSKCYNARGGTYEDLRPQFEAVSAFDDEDKAIARTLLESLILI